MAPSSKDDFNWLYRQEDSQESEPEHTRVLPVTPDEQQRSGPPTAVQPPVRDQGQSRQPAAPPRPARSERRPRPAPQPAAAPGSARRRGGNDGSAPPPGSQPPPTGGSKPKRPAKIGLRVVIGLLVLFVVGLIAIPAFAWSRVERVDEAPSGDRPPDQPGTTFLLVGSDSRDGLTKEERKKLGTGQSAGGRTDTVMIMYVPVGGDPVLVSLPRDSFVPIPGNGENKINAAYAFGGPKLLVETVEQNTGLRIDGYLEVGFGGFVNVIDALGGIEMCLPKAIKDKDSHINLKKGCQELAGADALGYVRMRKADARGDLGRVQRQRQMLAAMAKKAASPASVLNPVRYWQLNNAAASSLKLGEETSALQMITMANGMRKVSSESGLTLTVPIANPDAQTSAGSAVLWDDDKADEMFGEIARGDTSKLKRFAEKE